MMDNRSLKMFLYTVIQIVHLALAGGFLMLGLVVFVLAAPLFDLLGLSGQQRNVLPDGVFQVDLNCTCSLRRIFEDKLFSIQNISSSTPGVKVRYLTRMHPHYP